MSHTFKFTDDAGVEHTMDLARGTVTYSDKSGQLITMDLGQSDVHIDQALANYAAGFRFADTGLIGDDAVPAVPVPKASDKFYTWGKDDVFQLADDISVSPGGVVKELNPTLSSTSFSTVPYGLGSFIPTEISGNQDAPLNVEMQAVAMILGKLRLARENRIAQLLLTAANWTGGYAAAAVAKWNGGVGSDPVGDILKLKESSLTPVNALAMSERTWHAMITNAQFQKYFAAKSTFAPAMGVSTENASRLFADLLGVDRILVGKRKKKLTPTTYGYVWGDNVAGGYAEAGMPMNGQTIATAKTFRWSGADGSVPDGTVQGGFLVRSYFDPKRGPRGGRMIVVTHNDADVMTSVFAGGLITGAHA